MVHLVGRKAPHFSSSATVNGSFSKAFSLDQFIRKSNVLFFFYPKSFTSLCQSELQAFDARIEAFKAVDTVVVGCSTDTSDVHKAFMNVPQSEGGIAGIQYPLVFDANKTISTNYDVLSGDYDYEDEGLLSADSDMVALRGLFLIDKTGVVQHQLINF
ncbi:MAG: redoxin domain-containing protein [Flavobacteriales bacterium]|nr:redoxin domain-containing protein [Flavobacteriales bacterium]